MHDILRPMTISEMLLPEFDEEMKKTRKMLEAVPDGEFGWKPHEKSMTLGRLASHTAEMPGWAMHVLDRDRLVLTPDMKPLNAATKLEILAHFDKVAEEARAFIASATDEYFQKIGKWRQMERYFSRCRAQRCCEAS